MAQFNFIKYSHFPDKPYVSIRGDGYIGFSMDAVRQFQIRDYPYVEIYYDKDARVIGFRFKKEKIGKCLKLSVIKSNTCINTKVFLRFINFDHKETTLYELKLDKESQFFYIELDKSL